MNQTELATEEDCRQERRTQRRMQELDVGDEWPEDVDTDGQSEENYIKQAQWMQHYII